MKKRVEKYITIKKIGATESGKTFLFHVVNVRTKEICGLIKWYGGFRKYCFYPTDDFLFDSDCLTLIAEKLSDLNTSHRKELCEKAGKKHLGSGAVPCCDNGDMDEKHNCLNI